MRYWIDALDRITNVDDQWDEFAEENAGVDLHRTDVVGRKIWDFVAGPETRQVWDLLFEKAREKGHLHVRIRCDSPSLRRDLLLEVSAGADSSLEISSEPLRIEERPPQRLLDSHRPTSGDFLRICSWCKNVQVGTRWVDVEEATGILGLLEASTLPSLTHGLCPSCHDRLMGTIAERAQS